MLRVLMMLAVLGKLEALPLLEDAAAGADEPAPTAAAEPAESVPVDAETLTRRPDPNYSRLMLLPSGRPLRKGDGFFSVHGLVYPGVAAFPGFTVGVTDNVSLAGGVSMIPGVGLSQQLFFVSPSVGFTFSDTVAVTFGAFLADSGEDGIDPFGLGFAVATFGKPRASLSVGFAAARELDSYGRTDPILIVGGQVRLARSVALVTENWLMLDGAPVSQQPYGFAVRLFGERLSADIGLVLVAEELDDGIPIPWISFTYHFGPTRGSRSPAPRAPMLTGGRPRP